MINYPEISPYIFELGPIKPTWYGLMYVLGFASSYFLFNRQVKKKDLPVTREDAESLYFYLIVGLILGARVGYILFYNFGEYVEEPLQIFAIWKGGMSFHGGLIGTLAMGIYYTVKRKKDFWMLADLVIVTAPVGLFYGRMGNFINGELFGRHSDMPWAMVFPKGGPMPRHPSQLYEAMLEGVLLFFILWVMKDRTKRTGMMVAAFLVLYGLFRSVAEFFRQPDSQLGFVAGPLTMGQVLSLAMIVLGIAIFIYRRRTSPRVD